MKYLKSYQLFEKRTPKPKELKKSNLDKIKKGIDVGYIESYEINPDTMTLTVKFIPEMNEPDYLASLEDTTIGNRIFYAIKDESPTPALVDGKYVYAKSETQKYNDKLVEVSKRFIKANKSTEGVTYKGKMYANKEIIPLLRHNSELMKTLESRWDYHPYATEIEAKNGTIGFLYAKLQPEKEKFENAPSGFFYSYKLTKSGKLYDGGSQPIVLYNSKPLNDFSDYEKALQFLINRNQEEFDKDIKRYTNELKKDPRTIDRIPQKMIPYINPDVVEVAKRHKGLIDRTSHIGIFDIDDK